MKITIACDNCDAKLTHRSSLLRLDVGRLATADRSTPFIGGSLTHVFCSPTCLVAFVERVAPHGYDFNFAMYGPDPKCPDRPAAPQSVA